MGIALPMDIKNVDLHVQDQVHCLNWDNQIA